MSTLGFMEGSLRIVEEVREYTGYNRAVVRDTEGTMWYLGLRELFILAEPRSDPLGNVAPGTVVRWRHNGCVWFCSSPGLWMAPGNPKVYWTSHVEQFEFDVLWPVLPTTAEFSTMRICPKCGDKRCPRAWDSLKECQYEEEEK